MKTELEKDIWKEIAKHSRRRKSRESRKRLFNSLLKTGQNRGKLQRAIRTFVAVKASGEFFRAALNREGFARQIFVPREVTDEKVSV
jgi:hypothetical protein